MTQFCIRKGLAYLKSFGTEASWVFTRSEAGRFPKDKAEQLFDRIRYSGMEPNLEGTLAVEEVEQIFTGMSVGQRVRQIGTTDDCYFIVKSIEGAYLEVIPAPVELQPDRCPRKTDRAIRQQGIYHYTMLIPVWEPKERVNAA